MHPTLSQGSVAVVTGAASGLGLAAAHRLAGRGLRLCLADLAEGPLHAARDALIAAGAAPDDVITVPTDVGDVAQLTALADRAFATFGSVNVLMNNAGMQPGSSIFDTEGNWDRIIAVNMFGIIRGSQIFAPRMMAGGKSGLIVNTGSKQGITTPPGDAAYNISKSGVKVFTEALQHALRNAPDHRVEARLFIPGFVFTPLSAPGCADKPDGAWTAEKTITFLIDALDGDDFYILCPDDEVDRSTDARRILWAAGDIVENRPPLSRWHKDHTKDFASR